MKSLTVEFIRLRKIQSLARSSILLLWQLIQALNSQRMKDFFDFK